MSNKQVIQRLIKSENKQLSLKEVVEKTGVPKTSAQRILKNLNYEYKVVPWNKGLTKENSTTIMAISQKLQQVKGWKHDKETKEKIAKSMKGKGGIREAAGRGNAYNYGEDVISSDYELKIAQILDEEGISWNNSNSVMNYSDTRGITRMIYLGFYLNDYDLYITVKYHINNDTRKQLMRASKQNNVKVIIVDEMMFRRITFNSIKEILKNSLQG